jgi:biotin carboxyl carrier protein
MNIMTVRRTAIFVIVLGALAAWIAAAATSGVREIKPVAPFSPPAIDTSGTALEAEIARLHDRLRPTASPRLARDLFQFAAVRPRITAQAAPTEPAPVSIPAPAPPPRLTLIGVAQDGAEGGAVRTAIISTAGQLFLVKEGDEVTSAGVRYRVTKIFDDAADLSAADQTLLHLALK